MITNALRNGIMAGIIEAGNILDPAAVFIGVFSAINDVGRATILADITRPTGLGFNLTAVTTWGAQHNLTDGRRAVDAPVKVFSPVDNTEATTVLGWYVASAATAGTLYQFGYFPSAIPLPDESSQVTVVLRFTVDPNARWDATVSING
jgi:hypothetical protein